MKAKTILGMIACASACVSLSAFGNTNDDWFAVIASPAVASAVTIQSNEVTVAIENIVADSKISLDGDTTLTFTPTVADPVRSDNLVIIESSAVLTPNAAGDLPPSSELTDAQVGFAVAYDGAATNYYCYANGAWGVGAGTPPADSEVTFKITLDYRTNRAKFEVGSAVVSNDVVFSGTKLNSIAATGSGSLTRIDADYEVAVAAVVSNDGATTNRYGSVAAAKVAATAAGAGAKVQGVSPTGETQAEGAPAANGLDYVVCEAMGLPVNTTSDEATIKLESATKSNAGKITLAWKKPQSADNGVTIKFQVKKNGVDEGEPCDWDDIQIPMASGTYTVEPSIQ